jgi:hypothetical protein
MSHQDLPEKIASLYTILRDLETQGFTPAITSYGRAEPKSNGQQGYALQRNQERAQDYVLKGDKEPSGGAPVKVSAGNIFQDALRSGYVGRVQVVFRMQFDAVAATLKPGKPYLAISKEIKLQAGKPLRIGWTQ